MPPTPPRPGQPTLTAMGLPALPPVALPVAEVHDLADAFTLLRQGLKAQQQNMVRLNAALADTGALKERVRLTLEEERAQRALSKALAEERNRQKYGAIVGGARNLLGIGTGGDEGGLSGGLKAAGAALFSFAAVAKAAPGTVQRLKLAFEDTLAVVGQRLAPVFEQVVIPALRFFGDLLQSILPPAGDVRDALAPIADLFEALGEALAPVVPVVRDVLVAALKGLGVVLRLVVEGFKSLLRLFGVDVGGGQRLQSSVGAAARNIKFESPDAAAKEVYAAAFKNARAGGQERTPMDKVLEKFDTANSYLDKIFGADSVIGQLLKGIGETVAAIVDLIPKPVKDVVEGVFGGEYGGKIGDEIADAVFGRKGPYGHMEQPASNSERARLSDVAAKAAGRAQRVARRAIAAGQNPTMTREFQEAIRDFKQAVMEYGQSKESAESQAAAIVKWAEKASGRGLDGHPAGAGGGR